MTVYGMGLRKTPESLRRAVDRFIFLEDLDDAAGDEQRDEPLPTPRSTEPRRVPDLRRLLERAVNGTAHDDGWASLSSVANHVIRVEPSFSVKDYGASKLVDLVRAQDYLEVDQPDSGSVRVRLARAGPPRRPAPRRRPPRRPPPRRRPTKTRARRRHRARPAGSRPEPAPEPVRSTR